MDEHDKQDERWVELRVHGVSGTPPGSMLDRPHVQQVGGDDESRYFRSVDAAGAELPGAKGQVLEAYHWGRLTSGSRVNALWLLLLPFGMVNAAHYMLPPPARKPLQLVLHATCDGLIRFVGVLLTTMYAFAAGLVLIDLIGWRWALQKDGLTAVRPGILLAVAAVLSAVVVLVLAYLGRGYGDSRIARLVGRLRSRDEVPAAGADAAAAQPPSAREQVDQSAHDSLADTPLARETFYSGDSRAEELKELHVAAGLLTVALMAVWVVEPGRGIPTAPGGWVAALLWGFVALVVLLFGDPEGGTRVWSTAGQTELGRRWSGLTRALAPGLLVLSVGVLLYAVIAAGFSSISVDARARPTSFDVIANNLLLVGVATLFALLLTNAAYVVAGGFRRAAAAEPERYFEPYAFGHAAAMVTLVGTFVGVGLAAVITTGVSTLLDRGKEANGIVVGTTPMLDRVAYAWGLNMLLLLVLGIFTAWWANRRAKRDKQRQRLAAVYGDEASGALPKRWAKKVRRAAGMARMKNYVGFFVAFFALGGLVFSGVTAYELTGCLNDSTADCRTAPGPLNYLSQPKVELDGLGGLFTTAIGQLGAWLVLLAAGLLLLQGRKAFKTEDKRRTLNVIWDVLAFWPHATHPFSPRPYSKRCVHDLRRRIEHHLEETTSPEGPRDVVVCAHSQGSLIAFAALLQMSAEQRDRVALVTFGSQLRVIFPRAFPAYVNYPAIKRLYDELAGAWINLYRLTDPIAGPVLSWAHSFDTGKPPDPPRSYHFPPAGTWNPDWAPSVESDIPDPVVRTLKCGADWQLADPVPADPDLQSGAVAELLRHSWFPRQRDWIDCLQAVRATRPLLTQPPPPPDVPEAEAGPTGPGDAGGPGRANGAASTADLTLPTQADVTSPRRPARPAARFPSRAVTEESVGGD